MMALHQLQRTTWYTDIYDWGVLSAVIAIDEQIFLRDLSKLWTKTRLALSYDHQVIQSTGSSYKVPQTRKKTQLNSEHLQCKQ